MYPSIAFNVLYQKQPQEQSVRSIRCLPDRMLRDLGLSRGNSGDLIVLFILV